MSYTNRQPMTLSLQEIANPREVIQTFFDQDYGLAFASKRLHKWLRSAFARKSRFNRMDVLNMLYFQEQFVKLMEAAQLLANDTASGSRGAILDATDHSIVLDHANYCSVKGNDMPAWDCFPRHLNLAEYANPYRALEKCFRHKTMEEWREFLKNLFYAGAQNNSSLGINDHEEDIYQSCRYLFKLLEACHLVYVRESY